MVIDVSEDVVRGLQWLVALAAATVLGLGLALAISLWILQG